MNTTPPRGLTEFSLILFRPQDAIGKAIVHFQWGLSCQSPEFCHVAVLIEKDGELMAYEENWPKPRYRALDSIDWDEVTVMSFIYEKLPDESLRDKARAWCDNQISEQTYGIPSILSFAWHSMMARVPTWFGIWGARRAIAKERSQQARDDKFMGKAMQVCSEIVDSLFLDVLKMDLVPKIARGQCCPGDLTLSTLHRHSFGRLGE